MAINNFIKSNVEAIGVTNLLACPVCGEEVCLSLYRSYDIFNPIALFKQIDTQTGIAVCPKCAAAFKVAQNYIDAKLRGQTVFVTAADLTAANAENRD